MLFLSPFGTPSLSASDIFIFGSIPLKFILFLSKTNRTFCPKFWLSAIFSNRTTSAPFFLACFTI